MSLQFAIGLFAALITLVWGIARRYHVVPWSRRDSSDATKTVVNVIDVWTMKVYTLVFTRADNEQSLSWQCHVLDKYIQVKPTHDFNVVHMLALKVEAEMKMEARTYKNKNLAQTMKDKMGGTTTWLKTPPTSSACRKMSSHVCVTPPRVSR